MTIKCMVAVALLTPFLTMSSMAQQYQGGPKSSVPPTTRQIASGSDIYAQEVDIYTQGVRPNTARTYRGGAKTRSAR